MYEKENSIIPILSHICSIQDSYMYFSKKFCHWLFFTVICIYQTTLQKVNVKVFI